MQACFVVNCDLSAVKRALQNTPNDCYQWLSDSSRVHQIRFLAGALPDPLAGLRRPTYKGRKSRGRGKGRGKKVEKRAREVKGMGMKGKGRKVKIFHQFL